MATTETKIHPFEKAGLGKAPFRYVGMVHQEVSYGQRVIGSVGGIPLTTKPGGTCQYCGTYIVNMFNVESSDGNQFHVGSECIRKVAAEIGDSKTIQKVLADEKDCVKANKKNRDIARIEAAMAKLPTVAWKLAEEPHPTTYLAREGKTLLDWVKWIMANASTSGKLKAAHVIESA